jgi:hypothetical protein
MKKLFLKIFIGLISTVSIVLLACWILNYTIVIPVHKPLVYPDLKYSKSDVVRPLCCWAHSRAYIVLSQEDKKSLGKSFMDANCYLIHGKLLKELSDCKFKYTGGDVATVESYICIMERGRVYFEAGLAIAGGQEGLQNSSFGWVESLRNGQLRRIIKKAEKVRSPVLFL